MYSNPKHSISVLFTLALSIGLVSAPYSQSTYALSIGGINLDRLNDLPGLDSLQGSESGSDTTTNDACQNIDNRIESLKSQLKRIQQQLQTAPTNQKADLVGLIETINEQISEKLNELGVCQDPPQQIPSKVTGLTANPTGNNQIDLSWNPNPSQEGVVNYNVYRGTTPGFDANTNTLIATTNANSYSDTNLEPGTKYYYKVAAVNRAGIGPLSDEVSATTSGPVNTVEPGVISLDYETGDISQWGDCKEDNPPENQLDVIEKSSNPDHVTQGDYSLQSHLTENATKVDRTNGVRAEVYYCDPPGQTKYFNNSTLNDIWLHWYTKLPENGFPDTEKPTGNNQAFYVFTQFHSEGTQFSPYGVPISLALNQKVNVDTNGNPILENNKIYIQALKDLFDSQNCIINANENCGILWSETPKKDHWYNIWLHIKWSTQNDGFVEGTVDGAPIGKYEGPTLDPNQPEYQQMYLKQGLYRGITNNSSALIAQDQTVYNDGTEIFYCPSGYSFDKSNERKCVR